MGRRAQHDLRPRPMAIAARTGRPDRRVGADDHALAESAGAVAVSLADRHGCRPAVAAHQPGRSGRMAAPAPRVHPRPEPGCPGVHRGPTPPNGDTTMTDVQLARLLADGL